MLDRVDRRLEPLRLLSNYGYDARRFARHSLALHPRRPTPLQRRSVIVRQAHRLEKGLALPEPRAGFGQDVVRDLVERVESYLPEVGRDDAVEMACAALTHYLAAHGQHLPADLAVRAGGVANLLDHLDLGSGGTVAMTRAEVRDAAPTSPEAFFQTRHSLRTFDAAAFDVAQVQRAVALAQATPSVCNRQSCRVHVFVDPEERRRALALQNGNRGFGDGASAVLVVTSELQHFHKVGERNQGWVDGGMFAMSLVWALHAVGLGTCCLNWAVEAPRDRALKRACAIPPSESVIMLIAVGGIPERALVARSVRRPLTDVLLPGPQGLEVRS